jgi:hypothetical protein
VVSVAVPAFLLPHLGHATAVMLTRPLQALQVRSGVFGVWHLGQILAVASISTSQVGHFTVRIG